MTAFSYRQDRLYCMSDDVDWLWIERTGEDDWTIVEHGSKWNSNEPVQLNWVDVGTW